MIPKSGAGQDSTEAMVLPNSGLPVKWCLPQATWRERQRFGEVARTLIRLPEPHEDPLEVLLTEAAWRQLVPADAHEETVLAALSQETGIYFFPSQEWVLRFCRLVELLGVTRILEAGAGRGYLAAALAPQCARRGMSFLAVDSAQAEFESGLPRHPVVRLGSTLEAVREFYPELVLSAWPPPGQSIGPLLASAGVRFVLVVGEDQGGCTGDPGDWRTLAPRLIKSLSRCGLGRSGRRCHTATLFIGKKGRGKRER